jgi:hypothetical protein
MNAFISFLILLYAEQVLLNRFNAIPSYIETRACKLRNHEEEF